MFRNIYEEIAVFIWPPEASYINRYSIYTEKHKIYSYLIISTPLQYQNDIIRHCNISHICPGSHTWQFWKDWVKISKMTYVWKITKLSLFTQNNIYIWHRLKISLNIYRIHDILYEEPILHDVLGVECGWKVCGVKVSWSCINLLQLLKLNWSFSMFLVFSFSHTQCLIYVTSPAFNSGWIFL